MQILEMVPTVKSLMQKNNSFSIQNYKDLFIDKGV